MAKQASSSFLLILLLSILILSIDAARPLKFSQNTLTTNAVTNTTKEYSSFINADVSESLGVPPPPSVGSTDEPQSPPTPAGRGVDGFRPTTPGHSPGVGHSTHN
ncbi:Precursor of CEP3 [Linum perenne]